MDGSQGIAWTEDENGVRVYFGPRWTGEAFSDAPRGLTTWVDAMKREPRDVPYLTGTDDVLDKLDRVIGELRGAKDAYVWTPNGMRPR